LVFGELVFVTIDLEALTKSSRRLGHIDGQEDSGFGFHGLKDIPRMGGFEVLVH
jgi:hypothetical protein